MVSFLNGLAAAGAGLADFAGKAASQQMQSDLQMQQLTLANTLATQRDLTVEGVRHGHAMDLQGSSQTFQAGQTDKTIAAQSALEGVRQSGENARAAAQRAAQLQIEKMKLDQEPETIRLLRALGALPSRQPGTAGGSAGGGAAAGGAPSPSTTGGGATSLPGPRASGGTAADGSVVPPSPGYSGPASPSGSTSTAPSDASLPSLLDPTAGLGTTTTGTAATGASGAPKSGTGTSGIGTSGTGTVASPSPASLLAPGAALTPILRKALGYPQAGSEEEVRSLMSNDINNDPAFRYKTAGEKAAELENRLAVAKGVMTDPKTRSLMAQGIASYQIEPMSAFALSKPGGSEIMAEVMRLNPQYQVTAYNEKNRAMEAFGTGKEGGIIRNNDASQQHLDTLAQVGVALGNGDLPLLNRLKNTVATQFGVPVPKTFDALKQIVATEVVKAIAGTGGGVEDRQGIMRSLDSANTPEALKDILDGFRGLMLGQIAALKRQYEASTGIKDGPFAFDTKLHPRTREALKLLDAEPAAPAQASAGAALPSWVKPGDTYSPSVGLAKDAKTGQLYQRPQFNAPAPDDSEIRHD
jgi:hypothetical protein